MRRERQLSRQAGTAVTEFILVFPSFLLTILLCLEFSLYWVDKHMLKLAAFEVARQLAQVDSPESCAKNSLELEAAHRRAALRMASVSPSVGSLFRRFGLGESLERDSSNFASSGGRVSRALSHLLLRLPSAYALTKVSCQRDEASVRAEVSYLRAPVLPFVGQVLWATYVLSHLNQKARDLGLSFDLDQNYFGLEIKAPRVKEAMAMAASIKKDIKGSLKFLESFSQSMNFAQPILQNFPSHLGQKAQSLLPMWQGKASSLLNELDSLLPPSTAGETALDKTLQQQGDALTKLTYWVPEVARLIPMTVKIEYVLASRPEHKSLWTDGKALFIAPFASSEKPESQHWNEWAKAMSLGAR